MKAIHLCGILAFLLSTCQAMGPYDQDWVTKVRLPLSMINKIYALINFDPTAQDQSADLYSTLVAFDTFETFTAIPGFGFAFQDQIGALQENVAQPVETTQSFLEKFGTQRIDLKIMGAFPDDANTTCATQYLKAVSVIRDAYQAVNRLI